MLALTRHPGERVLIEPAGLVVELGESSRLGDGAWLFRWCLNGQRQKPLIEEEWRCIDFDHDIHFVATHGGNGRIRCVFDAPREQRILREELTKGGAENGQGSRAGCRAVGSGVNMAKRGRNG